MIAYDKMHYISALLTAWIVGQCNKIRLIGCCHWTWSGDVFNPEYNMQSKDRDRSRIMWKGPNMLLYQKLEKKDGHVAYGMTPTFQSLTGWHHRLHSWKSQWSTNPSFGMACSDSNQFVTFWHDAAKVAQLCIKDGHVWGKGVIGSEKLLCANNLLSLHTVPEIQNKGEALGVVQFFVRVSQYFRRKDSSDPAHPQILSSSRQSFRTGFSGPPTNLNPIAERIEKPIRKMLPPLTLCLLINLE